MIVLLKHAGPFSKSKSIFGQVDTLFLFLKTRIFSFFLTCSSVSFKLNSTNLGQHIAYFFFQDQSLSSFEQGHAAGQQNRLMMMMVGIFDGY